MAKYMFIFMNILCAFQKDMLGDVFYKCQLNQVG